MGENPKLCRNRQSRNTQKYRSAEVGYNGHLSHAVIERDHDNIVETCFDGKIIRSDGNKESQEHADHKSTLDYRLTVQEILEFASASAVMALGKADATSGLVTESEIKEYCKRFERGIQ